MASQKTTLQKGQFERLVNKAKRLEKQIASCVQSHQKLAAQIEKNRRPCVVECKKKNMRKAQVSQIAQVAIIDCIRKNAIQQLLRNSLTRLEGKREGQRKKREQKRQINRQATKKQGDSKCT